MCYIPKDLRQYRTQRYIHVRKGSSLYKIRSEFFLILHKYKPPEENEDVWRHFLMRADDRKIIECVSTHTWWINGCEMDSLGEYDSTRHRIKIPQGVPVFVRIDRSDRDHVEIEVVRLEAFSQTYRLVAHEFERFFRTYLRQVHKYWQHDGDINCAYVVRKY